MLSSAWFVRVRYTCYRTEAYRVVDTVIRTRSRMPVTSNLRLLLAQANVERAKQGEAALSLRQLAIESNVSISVVTNLAAGRLHRIDYGTIDKLLTYLNRYIEAGTGDLLVWTPPDAAGADPIA